MGETFEFLQKICQFKIKSDGKCGHAGFSIVDITECDRGICPLLGKNKEKKNKFGAKKKVCHSGHEHDSTGEAKYCNHLRFLRSANQIRDYQIQVRYPMKVNGIIVCTHVVDFVVTYQDGTEEIHEFKGMQTALYKLKYKLFQALFPELIYKIVKRK